MAGRSGEHDRLQMNVLAGLRAHTDGAVFQGADCGEGADETFIKASVPGGCDEVRRASMILEARDEKIRKMQEGQ